MSKIRTLTFGLYMAALSPVVMLAADPAASDADSGIAGIANRVASNLSAIADLIGQIAFVAGMLFFVSAVFKFKQHKDNPTQVPVGTPLSMLAISAALMFMGNFINPLGETLFAGSGDNSPGAGIASDGFKSGFGS